MPWVIVLSPEPSEVPEAVRIRHLLKRALRDWGLRCESASETTLPEQLERLAAEVLDLQQKLERAERKRVKTCR